MPNDNLKTALTEAGMTSEQFADVIQVDPKTVQRWVSGRTPYARHRGTISRALDIPEHELWPDTVPPPTAPVHIAETRPTPTDPPSGVGAWASMDADGAPNPVALLTDVVKEVDLLDSFDTLLAIPGVAGALESLASGGCRVRGMVADQDAWTVPPIAAQLQMRTLTTTVPHHVLLRADSTLIIGLLLLDGGPPPLFAVTRQGSPGVFERLLKHLDDLWDQAEPLDLADRSPADVPGSSPPPTDLPGNPSLPADDVGGEQPPRRWPRRPD